MSYRIFPTMRQIINSAIVGIASHPRVQKPSIFLPSLPGSVSEEVKIQRWRTYGGYELQEPGLTCSVYPAYTSRSTEGSAPSPTRRKAVEIKPYTLGARDNATSNYEATYTLIVELNYTEPAIGQSYTLDYDLMEVLESIGDLPPLSTEHGLNVQTREGNFDLTETDLEQFQPTLEGLQRNPYSLQVEINPAEEILREYMDLLRLVLDDMKTMRPYTIRSSQVTGIDYPTSTWTRKASDALFHSAYLVWELSIYPPTSWKDIYFMPVTVVNPALAGLTTEITALTGEVGSLATGAKDYKDFLIDAADPVGTASKLLAEHVAAPDPHPQYIDAAELATAIGQLITGVNSFNGRSGPILPMAGDYTAVQVGADPAGEAQRLVTEHLSSLDPHPQYIDAAELTIALSKLTTGVSSFNNRVGDIVPMSGDYTAAQVGADAEGTAQTLVTNHESASDPHPQYVNSAELTSALDALTVVESFNGRRGVITSASGDYTAAQVGADAEGTANTLLASHSTAADPHPQYVDTAELNSAIAALDTGVSSFNNRSGAVTPEAGDYTAAQVGADPAGTAGGLLTAHTTALDPHPQYIDATELSTALGALTTGVSSFKGRQGAIVPTTGDYTAAQVGADPTGTASKLLTAHTAQADPHPQYIDSTELASALGLLTTGVSSFNGRKGDIAPTTGDYTASQVGADPTGTASSLLTSHVSATDPHPQYIDTAELSAALKTLVTGVSSFNGRGGTVMPSTGDYSTSQVTEGSNLYFTNARARSSLSAIAPFSYNSTTGSFSLLPGSAGQFLSSDGTQNTWRAFAYSDLSTLVGTGSNTLAAGNDSRFHTQNTDTGTNSVSFTLNRTATGTGADWAYTLQRPGTGMTGAVNFVLPPSMGSNGQVLITDGSKSSWTTLSYTAAQVGADPTGTASTLLTNHQAAVDPHPQYIDSTELSTALNSLVTGVSSFNGRNGAIVPTTGDYTTSLVTEGSNLYWTSARFDSAFTAKSTSNLSEGTNLYFTNARARSSLSGTAPISYNSATGTISLQQGTAGQFLATDGTQSSWRAVAYSDLSAIVGTAANTIAAGNDSRFHTQNTDTGTTSATFSLGGGGGILLRTTSGYLDVLTPTGAAFNSIRSYKLIVNYPGTGTTGTIQASTTLSGTATVPPTTYTSGVMLLDSTLPRFRVRQVVATGRLDNTLEHAPSNLIYASGLVAYAYADSTYPIRVCFSDGMGTAGQINQLGYTASALTGTAIIANTTNYIYIWKSSTSYTGDDQTINISATTLKPIYSYVTPTNPATNQCWYDLTTEVMKKWNGSGWIACRFVFIGQIITNSTGAIETRTYAYNRQYRSAWVAIGPNTNYVFDHNLGIPLGVAEAKIQVFLSATGSDSDMVPGFYFNSGGLNYGVQGLPPSSLSLDSRLSIAFRTGDYPICTGAGTYATSGYMKVFVQAGW